MFASDLCRSPREESARRTVAGYTHSVIVSLLRRGRSREPGPSSGRGGRGVIVCRSCGRRGRLGVGGADPIGSGASGRRPRFGALRASDGLPRPPLDGRRRRHAAALPSSASVSDPTGDDNAGFDPRGDLTSAEIKTDATYVIVTARSVSFDNPQSSVELATQHRYLHAVRAGRQPRRLPEYTAVMFNDGAGNVIAGVTTYPGLDVLCDATPSWNSGDKSYSVRIERSCVHSPASGRGCQ